MDKPKYSIADNTSITTARFDMVNSSEGGGDYTLPDYYPQIRKIVSYTADALPDTKFISGNNLEYGGTLAFNVFYIGEDGALVCVPYAFEYSSSQVLPAEVRGTAEIAIDAKAEDIQCRVLAPRKLSLKAKIKTRISANDKQECKLQMIGSDGETVSPSERAAIQHLNKVIPVMTSGRCTITGKVTGEIKEKQGAKPVSCSATMNITEVKSRRDCIMVRGEACVKCIVFTPDGYYAPARARFPFEETITAEGASEGDMCRAWGRAASVSVSEGDDGILKAEVEYDLDAEWCRKGEKTVVEDAYAAGRISHTERADINSHSLLCCTTSSLSLNGNGKRTTKPDANEYLIDMRCEASIDHAEQKDAHMVFTGACKIKAFIVSNGEIICEDMTLPIKYEAAAESPQADGRIILFSNVCCTELNGRLEGDTINANVELCISVCAKRENKLSPVSKITLEQSNEELDNVAQIKVFYGTKDERLWDVSKKYLAPINKIEAANSISRNDSVEGKAIIIPIGIG